MHPDHLEGLVSLRQKCNEEQGRTDRDKYHFGGVGVVLGGQRKQPQRGAYGQAEYHEPVKGARGLIRSWRL